MQKPLSVREVAAKLGVSVKTVRQLIRDGNLPAFRPGKRAFKVKVEDLDDYINRRCRALRRELDEYHVNCESQKKDQRRDE